ncbi:NlpC/P60 family protein [Propylenella binzhouense]|uniref:Peptidase P60 n=1 Tax=Propylenella binzhouense TaxID=2555902 RepID=A0A964T890_9HYPH|nr:NlpC/P60 family protein [Propylenella binzhouense]MYZ50338.1 peptidase P60 [Propylenella binzhouense]
MKRIEIVAAARGWIGTPYRHQASLRGVGCDCLGLVRGVWREVLGTEAETPPAYTPDWAEANKRETLAEAAGRHVAAIAIGEAEAGDLVLFRWRRDMPAKHVAILSGGGRMIHAQQGAAVAEVPLSDWWRRRAAFAFRFPGLEA